LVNGISYGLAQNDLINEASTKEYWKLYNLLSKCENYNICNVWPCVVGTVYLNGFSNIVIWNTLCGCFPFCLSLINSVTSILVWIDQALMLNKRFLFYLEK
jgi:hypothetical protein